MLLVEHSQEKLGLLCLKINLFYSIITSTVYINDNIAYAKTITKYTLKDMKILEILSRYWNDKKHH